jgi:hypothetical protein
MRSPLKLRHIAGERVVVRARAPRLVRRTAADSDRSHSFSRTDLFWFWVVFELFVFLELWDSLVLVRNRKLQFSDFLDKILGN